MRCARARRERPPVLDQELPAAARRPPREAGARRRPPNRAAVDARRQVVLALFVLEPLPARHGDAVHEVGARVVGAEAIERRARAVEGEKVLRARLHHFRVLQQVGVLSERRKVAAVVGDPRVDRPVVGRRREAAGGRRHRRRTRCRLQTAPPSPRSPGAEIVVSMRIVLRLSELPEGALGRRLYEDALSERIRDELLAMLPERTLKKDVYVWHVGTELPITVVALSLIHI